MVSYLKADQQASLARSEGYSTTQRHLSAPRVFILGTRNVWDKNGYGDGKWWNTADLIDGKFCNHQTFSTLRQALNRPL